MLLKKIPEDLDAFEGDLVVSLVGEEERPLRGVNAWLDWRLCGLLNELLLKGYFKGEWCEKCLVPTRGKFKFDRILLIGGGKTFETPATELGKNQWNELSLFIQQTAQRLKVKHVGLSLPRQMPQDEKALFHFFEKNFSSADLFIPRSQPSLFL